ncbi:hypothetical protein VTL71DRAFT_3039 [Oculimacula yallundae]|uniref:Uncharacterized protein n=1 Tax=Oculimacula yallundae TaxID=86028 RepID=A0ABR4C628_9HELO
MDSLRSTPSLMVMAPLPDQQLRFTPQPHFRPALLSRFTFSIPRLAHMLLELVASEEEDAGLRHDLAASDEEYINLRKLMMRLARINREAQPNIYQGVTSEVPFTGQDYVHPGVGMVVQAENRPSYSIDSQSQRRRQVPIRNRDHHFESTIGGEGQDTTAVSTPTSLCASRTSSYWCLSTGRYNQYDLRLLYGIWPIHLHHSNAAPRRAEAAGPVAASIVGRVDGLRVNIQRMKSAMGTIVHGQFTASREVDGLHQQPEKEKAAYSRAFNPLKEDNVEHIEDRQRNFRTMGLKALRKISHSDMSSWNSS